jgi:hypothetical protein
MDNLRPDTQNQNLEIHIENEGSRYGIRNSRGLSKAERVAAIIAAVPGVFLGSELKIKQNPIKISWAVDKQTTN